MSGRPLGRRALSTSSSLGKLRPSLYNKSLSPSSGYISRSTARAPALGGNYVARKSVAADSPTSDASDPMVALLEGREPDSRQPELTLPRRIQRQPVVEEAAGNHPAGGTVPTSDRKRQQSPRATAASSGGAGVGPNAATIARQAPAHSPAGAEAAQPAEVQRAPADVTAAPQAGQEMPETGINKRFKDSEIEFLASRVYAYLKRQLKVERERHGLPGFLPRL